ncbi:MAG: hypothetical protein JWM31_2399 [Solirubrobacterales bacterium]|nr:hypothetical protein [Solirubrobacterales bacterium]
MPASPQHRFTVALDDLLRAQEARDQAEGRVLTVLGRDMRTAGLDDLPAWWDALRAKAATAMEPRLAVARDAVLASGTLPGDGSPERQELLDALGREQALAGELATSWLS